MAQQKPRPPRPPRKPPPPKNLSAPSKEPEELDAVILIVKRTADNTEVIPVVQGDIRPTEVESIIKLGYTSWCNAKGLDALSR